MEHINNETENSSLPCKTFSKICLCGKKFMCTSSYYYHRKKCEALQNSEIELGSFICREENCKFTSKLSELLIQHLQSVHKIEIYKDVKIFSSYSEFNRWKEDFERETKACFLLRSNKKVAIGRREYFYCNRSGKYVSHSTGKRAIKFHGVKKIGFNCPANIKVVVESESQKVIATVTSFHYGHDTQLCHLSIPKSDKEMIANQLYQGIEYSHILRNLHADDVSEIERKHLCTRRDLHNISKSYRIKPIEKHGDDHISMDAYVEGGLSNSETAEIKKSHELATDLPISLVRRRSPITWYVKSEETIESASVVDNFFYKIKKQEPCKNSCKIKCQPCDICLHSYSCNCPDAVIGTNICKHIHLVVLSQKDNISVNLNENTKDYPDDILQDHNSDTEMLQKNTDSNANFLNCVYSGDENVDNENIETIKQKLLEKYMQLYNKIKNCSDINALLSAREHINKAYNILRLSESRNSIVPVKRRHQETAHKEIRKTKIIEHVKPAVSEKAILEHDLVIECSPILQIECTPVLQVGCSPLLQVGCSPLLQVECASPSILQMEHPYCLYEETVLPDK